MRKKTAILTGICLIFTLFMPIDSRAASGPDITYHWAGETIQRWMDKGFVSGYPDGSFKPEHHITRAEFMSLVNGAYGFTEQAVTNYTDVDQEDWYAGTVAIAKAAGYINGYSDGTIRPNDPISREETASVILKLSKLSENAEVADQFTDAQSMTWSKGIIGAIVNAKIMNGYPNGRFLPQRNIKRGEAVVTLDRAVNYAFSIPPAVTGDDINNKVIGMSTGMEYKLDTADWVPYEAGIFDELDLSGNHTLLVRFAENGIHSFSPSTTISFTALAASRGGGGGGGSSVDKIQPVITLSGAAIINLTVGDSFTEPGYTAIDNEDGDITKNVVVSGDIVNTENVGTYIITYNVSDKAGNAAAEMTRTIIVTEAPEEPDKTVPVITLSGAAIINLTVGDVFTEPGYTATDDVDGDITANVVVAGDTVKTETAGTYIVTYNVSDKAGNAAVEVIRTIIVTEAGTEDTTPPSVETLSNGGQEFSIPYGESVDLVFSEELTGETNEDGLGLNGSKFDVQKELFYVEKNGVDTGACNHTLQFEWISPTALRVTRDAGSTGNDKVNPGIFTRDVKVKITDLAGNTAEVTLIVSDPKPTIYKLRATVDGKSVESVQDVNEITVVKGSVTSQITVQMTEPIDLVGDPIVYINIDGVDYEYGTISILYPQDKTPELLKIQPYPGNEIAGLVGTFTFTVAAGLVRDQGPFQQENSLATFRLIVVDVEPTEEEIVMDLEPTMEELVVDVESADEEVVVDNESTEGEIVMDLKPTEDEIDVDDEPIENEF